VVVQDSVHALHVVHLRLPGSPDDGKGLPAVAKVVVVVIRRRAIGWTRLPINLILFFDAHETLLTLLDSSVEYGRNSPGTWEFNLQSLQKLCWSAGIDFQTEAYETARQFLVSRPTWAPPKMEFEVDHLQTERVREWGLAIALGIPMASSLLVVAGGFLIYFGPVGWFVEGLEVIGMIVAVVLTVWSHSRWRMMRSLRKRHLTAPSTGSARIPPIHASAALPLQGFSNSRK
jgi:hypothetical protein